MEKVFVSFIAFLIIVKTAVYGNTLTFTIQPSNTILNKELYTILECQAKDDIPGSKIYYQWLYNKTTLLDDTRDSFSNGTLLVKREFSGTYACLVSNKYGSIISNDASVLIQNIILPGFSQLIYSINDGEYIFLRPPNITAIPALKPNQIFWLQLVHTPPDADDQQKKWLNVDRKHYTLEGHLFKQVSFYPNSYSTSFQLMVKFDGKLLLAKEYIFNIKGPHLPLGECKNREKVRQNYKPFPDHVTVLEGDDLKFEHLVAMKQCKSSPLELTWYAPVGYRYQGRSIHIKNVQKRDEGDYRLYIIREGIHITRITTVRVLEKPQVSIFYKTVLPTATYADIIPAVNTLYGLSNFDIVWCFDGKQLNQIEQKMTSLKSNDILNYNEKYTIFKNGTLRVKDLSLFDTGYYQISVWYAGKKLLSKTALLDVIGKYGDCGRNKIVSNNGTISVMFSWTSPPDTFYCKWKIHIPRLQQTIFTLKNNPFKTGVNCNDAYMIIKTGNDSIRICPSTALNWKYITNVREIELEVKLKQEYYQGGFQMLFAPFISVIPSSSSSIIILPSTSKISKSKSLKHTTKLPVTLTTVLTETVSNSIVQTHSQTKTQTNILSTSQRKILQTLPVTAYHSTTSSEKWNVASTTTENKQTLLSSAISTLTTKHYFSTTSQLFVTKTKIYSTPSITVSKHILISRSASLLKMSSIFVLVPVKEGIDNKDRDMIIITSSIVSIILLIIIIIGCIFYRRRKKVLHKKLTSNIRNNRNKQPRKRSRRKSSLFRMFNSNSTFLTEIELEGDDYAPCDKVFFNEYLEQGDPTKSLKRPPPQLQKPSPRLTRGRRTPSPRPERAKENGTEHDYESLKKTKKKHENTYESPGVKPDNVIDSSSVLENEYASLKKSSVLSDYKGDLKIPQTIYSSPNEIPVYTEDEEVGDEEPQYHILEKESDYQTPASLVYTSPSPVKDDTTAHDYQAENSENDKTNGYQPIKTSVSDNDKLNDYEPVKHSTSDETNVHDYQPVKRSVSDDGDKKKNHPMIKLPNDYQSLTPITSRKTDYESLRSASDVTHLKKAKDKRLNDFNSNGAYLPLDSPRGRGSEPNLAKPGAYRGKYETEDYVYM